MISFNREELTDLGRSLRLEWLETNGLGGYAMGTTAGANTRRYHGLLCAALRPPTGRLMMLNKLEETVRVDGETFPLACNLYGGATPTVHPDGHTRLTAFRLDPWPVWTYQAGPARIEKAVTMLHRHNVTVVAYTSVEADRPITLLARPLLACRDHHHLRRAGVDFEPHTAPCPHGVRITCTDGVDLVLQFGDGRFWPATEWYYNFTYPEEEARGLDHGEDLYSPGEIEWTLRAGQSVALVASLGETPELTVEQALAAERARRAALADLAPQGDEVARTLFLAADQFLVDRPAAAESPGAETGRRNQACDSDATPEPDPPATRSIVAGYPWFTDWGRDTMIALPGLLLATGRHAEARAILETYAGAMHNGLIPNHFPDQGPAAYNTVDATLWLFVAARRYYDATGDLDCFAAGLFDRLNSALAAYAQGTDFGIRMDTDGLIEAGDPTTQLTWMDAKVGDWVVTPRHGKAVEINALWYSAVRTMEFFARKLDRDPGPYTRLGRLVKDSFVTTFWSDDLGYLYDCVRGQERDGALRPNQVIACALPYTALSVAQERSVLRAVTEKLLTPFGLRTLSPDDPRYRGRYEGDPWSRDGAYHQGTVWPWLLGPFLSAYMVHGGRSPECRQWVRELLQPLITHLREAGLGSISEVFDGDPPHRPGGCPFQAWSVAEILRVWLENRLAEVHT